ncbi:MAG: SPOR domain-containing protein [Bdellovibrionota bacterium]
MAGSLKSRESQQFSSSGSAKRSYSRSDQLSRSELGNSFDPSLSAPGSSGDAEGGRWEMQLSLAQSIVLWSVLAGTMVMVFLFGLYAGREQGIAIALEGHSGEAVRLPVANPIAAPDEKPSDSLLAGLTPEAGRAAGSDAVNPANAVKREVEHTTGLAAKSADQQIDFSAGAKQAAADNLAEDSAAVAPNEEALKGSTSLDRSASPAKPSEKPLAHDAAAPDPSTAAKVAQEKNDKQSPVKTVRSSAIPAGWYLQISAARTSKEANAVVKKLQSSGLKPIVETAEINRQTYYRVVLGPYATREATASARKAAISAKAAKGEPFLKLIK